MKSSWIYAALTVIAMTACSESTTVPSENWSTAPDNKSNTHRVTPSDGTLNAFFECLEDEGVTLISAHRGGEPENSLEGMAATLRHAPAIMEIDVATTADGTLILMHDDTLDRTTTGAGEVENTSYKKIRGLQLIDKSGHTTGNKVPTFAEALSWAAGKTILQIDFKHTTDFDDVIAEVRRQKATDRIIYIAYTLGQAYVLHKKHPDAMISITLDDLGDLNAAKAKGIPERTMLGWTGNTRPSQAVFDQLNNKDIEVIFGTLGGRNSIDNQIARSGNNSQYADLSKMGVDLLATDRPIEAHKALRKQGLATSSPKCGVY